MSKYDEYDDEPGFFAKYGFAIAFGVAVLILAAAGVSVYLFSGKVSAPKKPQEIMVKLLPPPPLPPPPPPPPPKIPPPPEPKMVEQPKVDKPEDKPKDTPKAPAPGPAGPAATGPASDFGLAGGGGGGGIGGGGGGSKYGWYAGKVQQAISEALRRNPKTHSASLHVKVRIWSDASGRVVRATISGSSGDAAIDEAIKNQVLTGLVLPEAPPSDMPMPIVLRLNEQRPN